MWSVWVEANMYMLYSLLVYILNGIILTFNI